MSQGEIDLSIDGKVRLSAHDIATMGEALLATRGAGKSWLAAVEVEQLIEAGYPVAVLDVVGEYWSLKAKYPVIIFGGKHADAPLDPRIGKEIAHIILDKRLQAVIDLTGMKRADQPFFIADFCEELYEYGLKIKVPCWLVIEEAQNFVPQVGNPACKKPILDIVEMGRHAGIGYCLVSHRSATIDKTALGLCDIVIFKRLTLPHDLNVVKDFFKGKDPRFVDIVKILPGLANEEALIYFPLRFPEPIKFRVAARKTPHVAETPTLELKQVVAPPELTAISKELTEYFRKMIKEKIVKRDELSELRSRLEELQDELDVRDQRIEQLEHDLELAQRFKIELPPELLTVPGFTDKVEYLEKELMRLYREQVEKAQVLEEENKALKAQLEAVGRHVDFFAAVKGLEAIRGELERSRKSLTKLVEGYSTTASKISSVTESLREFVKGFVSKVELNSIQEAHKRELENLRRTYEARIEALERAEDWRLNPSVIVRMSHVVNELNQLTDTGKQTLKVVATMDPSIRFSEDQIALAISRSPSTTRQYLKQLVSMGWVKQVHREFQNNITENLAKRLKEVQRPGQEPIPDIVIERCKKELQTFIRSL
jgi:hypothetical protein